MRDYDVAASRIHVIHSGVDAIEEFDPERSSRSSDLPGDGPRVLWPGRLVEQKDPMLTLDVLRLLRERGVDAHAARRRRRRRWSPRCARRARELGVAGR